MAIRSIPPTTAETLSHRWQYPSSQKPKAECLLQTNTEYAYANIG